MARVTAEQAVKQALFHLYSKVANSNPLHGFLDWRQPLLGQGQPFFDPMYKRDDDPVIYVFDVLENGVTGQIGIAGSTYFGTTFAFLRRDASSLGMSTAKRITALTKKMIQDLGVVDNTIVPIVYSYPKIGILGETTAGETVVRDLHSEEAIVLDFTPSDDEQGLYTWSFWDEFPQAGNNEDNWAKEDNFIDMVINHSVNEFAAMILSHDTILLAEVPETVQTPEEANQILFRKGLRERIDANPPVRHSALIDMPLRGQRTGVHCAPASLQMLYQYIYEADLDQDEIAEEMQMTSVGSTISGQRRAYERFFGADFELVVDRSPTILEFKDSIDNFLPVKTGIRGHARAAAGWQKSLFVERVSGSVTYEEGLMLVSDPEPIGQGSLRWENEKANQWRDFFFLKRRSLHDGAAPTV